MFQVSENLLSIYLDEYENTPWDALKYLIADVNYGGHVTDDCDRRLMQSYIYDYFTDEAIGKEYFKLSPLDTYVIPKVSRLVRNCSILLKINKFYKECKHDIHAMDNFNHHNTLLYYA